MPGTSGRNYPLLLTHAPGPFGYDDTYDEEGTLHSVRLVARERLSTPFELTVTADTTAAVDNLGALLRKPLGLTVRRKLSKGDLAKDRYFHGIIRGIRRIGSVQPVREGQGRLAARIRYELTVVPRLWLLALRSDCRIFQDKTAKQILQILFQESGVEPVEFVGSGDPTVRKYTTQYNETNLQFAHRIMQEAGLFYFFRYPENNHVLVLADDNGQFDPMPRERHKVVSVGNAEDLISEWSEASWASRRQTDLADYNPCAPGTPVRGIEEIRGDLTDQAEGAYYTWPAFAQTNDAARQHARVRMQAAEALAVEFEGKTTDPQFSPGRTFTVGEGVDDVDPAAYAVRSTEFVAEDESWIQGAPPASYATTFTCFRKSDPWRETISLPRPAMAGVFSAVVVGTQEDIETDHYGRIKVRPLFDKNRPLEGRAQGPFNSGGDIWVRVLSAWTGPDNELSRGWQHVPRIGTEVGLSFMNGDPDEPVVLGCFFNGSAKPPFTLPAEKTKQGFRSHTSPNTEGSQYNELSFDDAAGQERVYLRAQKNHDVEVLNDRTVRTTRNDSLVSVEGEISVSANAGGVDIKAATRLTLRVGGSSITLLPDSISLLTTGVMTVNAGADMEVSAGAAMQLNATGDMEIAGLGSLQITGTSVVITSLEGEVEFLAVDAAESWVRSPSADTKAACLAAGKGVGSPTPSAAVAFAAFSARPDRPFGSESGRWVQEALKRFLGTVATVERDAVLRHFIGSASDIATGGAGRLTARESGTSP